MQISDSLLIFPVSAGLLYLILIVLWLYHWLNLKKEARGNTPAPENFYSILIPARNESENIIRCLKSLVDQNFSKSNFEIIVIDDNSNDNTRDLVDEFIKLQNSSLELRLIESPRKDQSEFYGFKKLAIKKGIEGSKGNWIITTDADTWRGENWLKALNAHIDHQQPTFVSMPVAYENNANFLQKIQALELNLLIAIGAASIHSRSPNLANGANLAFKRSSFNEVKGYEGQEKFASGDDEFLLHKFHRDKTQKVSFLKDQSAIVYTRAHSNLSDIWQQRKRWVSKTSKYENRFKSYFLLIPWGYHFAILFFALLGFYRFDFLVAALILYLFKILAELLFLIPVTSFFKQSKLLRYYLPASILYVLYVALIGILAPGSSFKWKERKLK